MSTFSGLNTALSALQAQRRGLELAGQNIANAGTEGYSRQRLELSPVGGGVPARYTSPSQNPGGVSVTGVTRLRDAYIEARGRTEHAQQALLTGRDEVINDVQLAFDEPSDTGLQSRLGELWAGFADVADNPGYPAARSQLLARAQTVADTLHTMSGTLSGQYADRRAELTTTVDEINSTAARLAELNVAVARTTQAGGSPNELADQRDVLALRLVKLTGATVTNGTSGLAGSVDLRLGGAPLVTGGTARVLTTTGSATLAGQAGDPVTVRWADSGVAASLAGGRTGGLLEGLGTTLPGYAAALDGVAAALAGTVNSVHQSGFTAAGGPGGAFFSGTTAATITVAITDPAAIAASGSASQALDGGNADRLAGLGHDPGGAVTAYRQLVSRLGVEVQGADRMASTQNAITEQLDAARASSAGVNLDEELTSMLGYQRAYEAASRLMTAIDSMLDTLINRTGS